MVHASLFSGIGAAEIAAHSLGWENAFHCEISDFCRRVLKFHFPNSVSYGDVREVNFAEWQGRVDILSGGFPCQPFSNAGQRKGCSDDRYLWPWMLECVRAVQPQWVVAENVVGLSSMEVSMGSTLVGEESDLFGDNYQIYESVARNVLFEILDSLIAEGYDVETFVIPALAVGAPHRRKRIFIVAAKSADHSLRLRREDWDEIVGNFSMPWYSQPVSERRAMAGDSADSYGFGGFPLFKGCESSLDNGSKCLCDGMQRTSRPFSQQLEDVQCFDDFPTQSPIFGGDDGFPFDVDGLAIPLSEWWKESVKAYGNAIVPAVIYEIFRAIDQIEFFAKEGIR